MLAAVVLVGLVPPARTRRKSGNGLAGGDLAGLAGVGMAAVQVRALIRRTT